MIRKGESSRLEALEALIAEKRKHEGYLAKLDERRAGTPEQVYMRLRDEYLMKLTDAQVRAQSEAEAIAGDLSEDDDAVREVEARLAALQEERVEGELRAAVGELDPKEWNKKLTALTASISLAEKERDARSEVVERTRSLLAEALGSAGKTEDAPGGRSASATGGASRSGMSGGPSFDELAFLSSVTGRAPSAAAPPPPQGAAAASKGKSSPSAEPAKSDAPVSAPGGDPRAKVETPVPSGESASASKTVGKSKSEESASVVEARKEPVAAPVAAPVAEPVRPPVAEPVAAVEIPAEAEPPAEEEPDAFGRPTPRTSQAVKTLKCQECGTFNFPTEWYCERCGGELAAL